MRGKESNDNVENSCQTHLRGAGGRRASRRCVASRRLGRKASRGRASRGLSRGGVANRRLGGKACGWHLLFKK